MKSKPAISSIHIFFVCFWEYICVPGENHRPVASNWQTFITKCCIEYTLPWAGFEFVQ